MNRTATMLTLVLALALPAPAAGQNPHELFQQALRKERADGDLPAAIALYGRVVAGEDRALAARALVRIGDGYERLGRADAREPYDRVVREYPDQAGPVREARARLDALAAAAAPPAEVAAGERELSLRLVWEDPGVDTEGQPTSDGRYLTFVDWRSGDLAVRDLAAGTHRRLTRTGYPQYALQSTVSNDDRHVAYFWTEGEGGSWQPQLRVIGMDGTGERTLIANEDREIEYVAPYDWTPDDRAVLAVLTRAGSWDITLTDVPTGEVRVVRSLTNGTTSRLSLSPDGRWIAYDQAVDRRDMDGDRNIFLVAADGSRNVAVTHHPATDLHPLFTPDGGHLLFTSDRGGSADLWAIAIGDDGPVGEPVLVKRDLGSGSFLMGFTAEGSLFYARDTGGGDVYAAPFDPATLRVTGEGTRHVQVFEGYNTSPAWSPDASRIAYMSRRGEVTLGQGAEMFFLDTGARREVGTARHLRFHRKWTRPVFSPDGRTVATDGSQFGEDMVFTIDVETGRERPLASAPGGTVAGWDPDGSGIYYARWTPPGSDFEGPEPGLFRYDLAAGRVEKVRDLPGRMRASTRVSPDGRQVAWLAYEEGATALRVATLDGGPVRELYRPESPLSLSQSAGVAWTPDSRHLVFARSRDEGWVDNKTRELLAIPVEGGDPVPTGLRAQELRHVSVLPGGSAIGYAAGFESHNEVWVMEDVLPILRQR